MARSFGRLFTTLWDDEDFRCLSIGAKLLYGFLISQSDLEHSGIIGWRPSRWALDLGEPVEDVGAYLKELDQARYVVIDEAREEVLVRSLIRRDEIWRQPNVFKAAAASAKASKSARIKATILAEIRRLDLSSTNRETHTLAADLIAHLEPFGNPSPNPPEGFPKPNGGPPEGNAKGNGDPAGTVRKAPPVDKSAGAQESTGQDPSGTVREPVANDSGRPTDKGNGYGPVVEGAFPLNLSPSPVATTEPVRGLWPAAVPDVQAEGEDSQDDETPDLPGLIAEVRAIRPDWATDSIERAMASRSVRERPWPLAYAAMLAVAADPESDHPGRVAHDGPWWKAGKPRRAAPTLPPWCGQCPPNRRLEDENGNDDGPCPRCNPKAARESA